MVNSTFHRVNSTFLYGQLFIFNKIKFYFLYGQLDFLYGQHDFFIWRTLYSLHGQFRIVPECIAPDQQQRWLLIPPHWRLNTGMAPTCDWMIKIVKVNKLYLNSLLVSIVNRVSRSGTMKYQCE